MVTKFLINANDAIWWPNLEPLRVAPPGGQNGNYCKSCWSNLQRIRLPQLRTQQYGSLCLRQCFFCLHANLIYFQLHDESGIKREEDQNIKLDWLVNLLANRTIPDPDSFQSCNSKPHVKSARVKLAPLGEASALGANFYSSSQIDEKISSTGR